MHLMKKKKSKREESRLNLLSLSLLLQTIRQGQGDPDLEAFFAQSSSPTAISTSSTLSSSSSSPSSTFLQHQYQRPTTYRPLLRRDDRVQIVQAIDYRIPKSLADYQFSTLNRNNNQQPAQSYARLVRIEGDQRVDSFVTY